MHGKQKKTERQKRNKSFRDNGGEDPRYSHDSNNRLKKSAKRNAVKVRRQK